MSCALGFQTGKNVRRHTFMVRWSMCQKTQTRLKWDVFSKNTMEGVREPTFRFGVCLSLATCLWVNRWTSLGCREMKDSLEKLCYPLLHPVSCQNGSSQAQPPTTLTFLIYPQCRTQNLDLSPLGDGSIQLQISHQLCNESSRPMVSVIVAKEKPMNPSSQVVCDDDPKSIFSSVFEEGT